jgi:hypothetical protein
MESIDDSEGLLITTEQLQQSYPLFASSLFNLVQNAEQRVGYGKREQPKKTDARPRVNV